MESGSTAVKRYGELGLGDALGRRYDYPWACHELSFLLRSAYPKLPKNLQALIFRDTLSAFRLLPEVQTSHGISSANLLVQAAEASFPKQKRSLAVSEFKHAMVAHKRRGKARQNGGSMQLPQDVLVHIFGFLDLRSLINLQYSLLFGDYDDKSKAQLQNISRGKKVVPHPVVQGEDVMGNTDWREAFKRKYIGNVTWKSATYRAICGHCKSIIWLSDVTIASSHHCYKLVNQISTIKPATPYKV
ncbi:F-box protein At5g52880 isoform X2 [Asparagus officinalis]|uniref:F-box protein At5g52880 isoform X2 n=1 Tax=Asparagus officinalis TaxID=4686 RepID=UPI00098DFD4C|nr:F-box protein At5g52880 isoform X2 [Asparagus officinalis]